MFDPRSESPFLPNAPVAIGSLGRTLRGTRRTCLNTDCAMPFRFTKVGIKGLWACEQPRNPRPVQSKPAY